MIGEIHQRRSFKALLDYVINPAKGAEIIAGNMAGETPSALAWEFELVRRMRPEASRPVIHAYLSVPPGYPLSEGLLAVMAQIYALRMRLSEHQWVAVRHHDTGHDHIHIVANRVSHTGKLWDAAFSHRRSARVCGELHTVMFKGNVPVPMSPADRKRLSRGEVERAVRTGEPPVRMVLQALVDNLLRYTPLSLSEFVRTLEATGARVRVRAGEGGKIQGLALGWGECYLKASNLGRAYAWSALKEKGITVQDSHLYGEARNLACAPGAASPALSQPPMPKANRENLKGDATALRSHLNRWAETLIAAVMNDLAEDISPQA